MKLNGNCQQEWTFFDKQPMMSMSASDAPSPARIEKSEIENVQFAILNPAHAGMGR
jgi:hypothetical protein